MVAGLWIWPDTVKKVFALIPIRYPRKGNLQCLPRKDARFALQDASLRICPQETHPWLDEEQHFLDEDTDGFVEILTGGSTGLVVADAVVFRALS